METTNQDNLTVVKDTFQETEKAKEMPIKVKIWNEAPSSDVDMSIRERITEFFDGPEISPKTKALGIISQELLIQTSKEIDGQNFLTALHNQSGYAGKLTVYAMELFEDRLNFALSPIGDYPNFSLEVSSISLDRLNSLTGNVAQSIAERIPNVVDVLLSKDSSADQKGQAKTDLMRSLVKSHSDDVKIINDGLFLNTGLAFVPDGQNAIIKLYMHEIPATDPVLGGTIELLNAVKIYKDTEALMNNAEMLQMTTEKITNYLKKLPQWAQKKLMGKHPDPGSKAWRIFQFFEKFGYEGNWAQRKFKKSEKMSMGFVGFMEQLHFRVLRTIIKGGTLTENNLDKKSIDQLFIENYEQRRKNKKLPEGFSIIDIVMDKVPIVNLKIN